MVTGLCTYTRVIRNKLHCNTGTCKGTDCCELKSDPLFVCLSFHEIQQYSPIYHQCGLIKNSASLERSPSRYSSVLIKISESSAVHPISNSAGRTLEERSQLIRSKSCHQRLLQST